ncbi:MAG: hypothetical protein K1Y02_23485, partial [Candidatus Hydrogenedentes bacterium]|nr:hypothetical protein [Candidatus Hydrogenedentota bacterium]
MDLEVTCACGHRIVVSEFAIGMTNACPGCGKQLTVNYKNARPIDADIPRANEVKTPVVEQPVESPFSAPVQEAPVRDPGRHCARCGRAFRGDWDRYRTSAGVVCHICSNQAIKPEEQSITGFIEPVESLKIDPVEVDLPPAAPSVVIAEAEDVPWYKRITIDEDFMRKVALVGAVLVLAVAAYYWVTQGFEVPERGAFHAGGDTSEPVVEGEPVVEATPAHARALFAISLFTAFISYYIGIFMYLTWANRMPNETLIANLIVILPVALGIAALSYVPFIGYLAIILILFKIYDFEWF